MSDDFSPQQMTMSLISIFAIFVISAWFFVVSLERLQLVINLKSGGIETDATVLGVEEHKGAGRSLPTYSVTVRFVVKNKPIRLTLMRIKLRSSELRYIKRHSTVRVKVVASQDGVGLKTYSGILLRPWLGKERYAGVYIQFVISVAFLAMVTFGFTIPMYRLLKGDTSSFESLGKKH